MFDWLMDRLRARAASARLAYAEWAVHHHPDIGRRGLYARVVRAAKLKETR